MAQNIQSLNVNAGAKQYTLTIPEKIYDELGLSAARFAELLARDFYCPTLTQAPTESTLTYTDTDGSVNHFQVGQPARWREGGEYQIAICIDITETSSKWHVLTSVGAVEETDPVFTASPAYTITNDRMDEWDNKMSETPVVSHGNGDTTFELTPNVLHIWNEVSSLNLTLAVNTTPNVYTEYMFQFASGSTPTTLILPSNVIFPKQPEILANKTYQVSILNDLAIIVSF